MSRLTAIVQARMGSTRLPGKVLRPLVGRPMLWHIVRRLEACTSVRQVVIATSEKERDLPIVALAAREGIRCFVGSETDVLDRFYRAARWCDADPIVRITADCPLLDPHVIDRLVGLYVKAEGAYDHVAVATGAGVASEDFDGRRFPDGLDSEVFSFRILERVWYSAQRPEEREHVTLGIWSRPEVYRLGYLLSSEDLSHLKWTVDDERGWQFVVRIYERLYREGSIFGLHDVLDAVRGDPELSSLCVTFQLQAQYQEVLGPRQAGFRHE